MTALGFFALLLGTGVWLIGDGWYSLLHYQKTTETFWRNNIFRWIRLTIGILLIYMAYYFGVRVL